MNLVYAFSTDQNVDLEQVGGKAMSLITMSRHGLPVPSGFVLTVEFFQPWLETIKRTTEWRELMHSFPEDLKNKTMSLQAISKNLPLDHIQMTALDEAINTLMSGDPVRLFAVRSSSPEEDLEELSFAGGYETVLGVPIDGLEAAIRRSFASCLDERVFVYKNEHGLPIEQPRIAVIVQTQIPADVAGVGFTLNPVNNCYDEMVINGNFGLGESVVSGIVSPDTFIVDKVTREILERKTGRKETSVWLDADGGTYEEIAPGRESLCLTDEQVIELTDAMIIVEDYFGKPMDVEWAYSAGKLEMLQARPITAYFPLPNVLLTQPGGRKMLYGDITLSKWGMGEPVSVMGTDYLKLANAFTLRLTMGNDTPDEVINQLRTTVEGRTYANISHSSKMQGKKRAETFFREIDTVSADIVANIDEAEYIPEKLPPELKGILFKMISQNLGVFWHGIQAMRKPELYQNRYIESVDLLKEDLAKMVESAGEMTMREFAERTMGRMIADVELFFPVIFAAEIAKSKIQKLFKDEEAHVREKVIYLERALPHNVTIAMGLSMYQLSSFSEISECSSSDEFLHKLEAHALSPQFLEAWHIFMDTYGFRSPGEMDPAADRFYDQPAQLYERLRSMAQISDPDQNPQAIFNRAGVERGEAYALLLQIARQKGKRRAKQFEKNYQNYITLGGFRETPKYCFSLITDLFRRRVLAVADTLVENGRLDSQGQVFDLTIDELDRALVEPTLDLRSLAEKNTYYQRKFKHVHAFPRIIDSRGKILRPPTKTAGKNELVGEPISPGSARGVVKVLHSPDEKPVLPGEILVTRATDPGWTPLFLNAAGIILEVGGMLQHGALVAREYGKPCISGLMDATEILKDGQLVEIDGASGIVRLI